MKEETRIYEQAVKKALLLGMCVYLIIFIFCAGWFVGERKGSESGARQMARHILNPAFETDGFYAIMGEECGADKGWKEMNGNLVFYKEGVTIDGRCLSPEEKEYFTPLETKK